MLISPQQKSNFFKFRSASIFEDYYEQYTEAGYTGTVGEYLREEQLGIGYKEYYESSEREMFFFAQEFEGKWYVYDASRMGGLYWPRSSE